ncbi:uncharacterized protein BJ171DRAFT_603590 [Polychytrium aggregatum]|uniref:uncharacterized protein n=1 Tax=Polychytrium aggregatum TaxID=110093 RepID=UPI0022FDBE7E|nr:uncharacterized protein BJ171DRAFT_603590 [Polychytrium aggregatum]KAI9193390.1 hypothetical protein BJ171DRAFT_603590 [Polychytrium aggregatum]
MQDTNASDPVPTIPTDGYLGGDLPSTPSRGDSPKSASCPEFAQDPELLASPPEPSKDPLEFRARFLQGHRDSASASIPEPHSSISLRSKTKVISYNEQSDQEDSEAHSEFENAARDGLSSQPGSPLVPSPNSTDLLTRPGDLPLDPSAFVHLRAFLGNQFEDATSSWPMSTHCYNFEESEMLLELVCNSASPIDWHAMSVIYNEWSAQHSFAPRSNKALAERFRKLMSMINVKNIYDGHAFLQTQVQELRKDEARQRVRASGLQASKPTSPGTVAPVGRNHHSQTEDTSDSSHIRPASDASIKSHKSDLEPHTDDECESGLPVAELDFASGDTGSLDEHPSDGAQRRSSRVGQKRAPRPATPVEMVIAPKSVSTTFSDDDSKVLLELIPQHTHHGTISWSRICPEFNKVASVPRTPEMLKGHYNRKLKGNGTDELVSAALSSRTGPESRPAGWSEEDSLTLARLIPQFSSNGLVFWTKLCIEYNKLAVVEKSAEQLKSHYHRRLKVNMPQLMAHVARRDDGGGNKSEPKSESSNDSDEGDVMDMSEDNAVLENGSSPQEESKPGKRRIESSEPLQCVKRSAYCRTSDVVAVTINGFGDTVSGPGGHPPHGFPSQHRIAAAADGKHSCHMDLDECRTSPMFFGQPDAISHIIRDLERKEAEAHHQVAKRRSTINKERAILQSQEAKQRQLEYDLALLRESMSAQRAEIVKQEKAVYELQKHHELLRREIGQLKAGREIIQKYH